MYYKIKKIVDETLGITSVLEQPRDKKFGHFALPTFSLAKSLKKSPQDIAQDFAKKLELLPEISSLNVVGGCNDYAA